MNWCVFVLLFYFERQKYFTHVASLIRIFFFSVKRNSHIIGRNLKPNVIRGVNIRTLKLHKKLQFQHEGYCPKFVWIRYCNLENRLKESSWEYIDSLNIKIILSTLIQRYLEQFTLREEIICERNMCRRNFCRVYFCEFGPNSQKFLPQINQNIAHLQKFNPPFFSFSHPQKFIPQNNGVISNFWN